MKALILTVVVALAISSCGSGQLVSYCEHYRDWWEAERDASVIERRNSGVPLNKWSSSDQDRWEDALDDSLEASTRFFATLPAGKTSDDAERECA